MALSIQDATKAALEVIKNLYGDSATNYRIEELFVPDPPINNDWAITIGMTLPDAKPAPQGALAIALANMEQKDRYERVYKRVTLDDDGNLKSVENRHVV